MKSYDPMKSITTRIVVGVLMATVAKASHLDNEYSTASYDNITFANGLPVKAWSRKLHTSRGQGTRHLQTTSNETYSDESFLASCRSQKSNSAILDVIIIGAGWSGLTAAVDLKSKGITNFKILEARDYVGGRSRTVTESWEGKSVPLDLGSQWIHGRANSPVFDIVEKNKLPYSTDGGGQTFYQKNNQGPFESNYIWALYGELYDNGFYQYQGNKQCKTNTDTSLRVMANEYAKQENLSQFKKDALEMFLNTAITQAYATNLDNLSLWWWDTWGLDFWDVDIVVPGGYTSIINAHAAPVQSKIETNAVVKKIDYRKFQVKVKYVDEDGKKKTIKAKKVLVTVPLGVLKSKSIKFQPKLPSKHRKAIGHLGMGTLNKIYMFWNADDVFWPTGTQWFADITTRQSTFEFFNPYALNGGVPMLAGYIAGDDATYLEDTFGNDQKKYEEEMSKRAMLILRNMFGQNIPEPGKIYVSKWGKDPFSKGSYSFNKVKMQGTARNNLRKPVKRRVYFAGEATNKWYHSTTHGAYLSGKDAAKKIMK